MIFFGFQRLLTKRNAILSFLRTHLFIMFGHLDLVRSRTLEEEEVQLDGPGIPRKHFQFVTLAFLALLFDLLFGLSYEYAQDGKYEWKLLLDSPYIIWHQMIPPVVWGQVDLMFIISSVTVVAMMVNLCRQHSVPRRFKVYPMGGEAVQFCVDGQVLNPKISEKLLKTSKLGRKSVKAVMTSCYFFAVIVYCLPNILFINGFFRCTTHSLISLFILAPIFLFYLLYFVFTIWGFVILSVSYIHVRQQNLLKQYIRLNARLERHQKSNTFAMVSYWRVYEQLNRETVQICVHIKGCSRYWAPILTVMFPYSIFMNCYELYLIVFPNEIPFIFQWIYFWAFCQMGTMLFAAIRHCAKVVKYSDAILEQNRKFRFLYQKCFSTVGGAGNLSRAREFLKAEGFQSNRRFHSYAFRLSTSHRITTRTFHQIVFYISVCFMSLYSSAR